MEHENEIFIRNFGARLFFYNSKSKKNVSILAALYHSTTHHGSKNSQDSQINKIRNREENFQFNKSIESKT